MIRESEIIVRNMKYLIYSNIIKILEIFTLSIVLIKIIYRFRKCNLHHCKIIISI